MSRSFVTIGSGCGFRGCGLRGVGGGGRGERGWSLGVSSWRLGLCRAVPLQKSTHSLLFLLHHTSHTSHTHTQHTHTHTHTHITHTTHIGKNKSISRFRKNCVISPFRHKISKKNFHIPTSHTKYIHVVWVTSAMATQEGVEEEEDGVVGDFSSDEGVFLSFTYTHRETHTHRH